MRHDFIRSEDAEKLFCTEVVLFRLGEKWRGLSKGAEGRRGGDERKGLGGAGFAWPGLGSIWFSGGKGK